LNATDVESLCRPGDADDPYPLPSLDEDTLINPVWQASNAARFGWAIIIGSPAAGLAVAWLIAELPDAGPMEWLGGMLLGCALAKLLVSAVMGIGYAHLHRRLERKLGVRGILVGLAPGAEPCLFNGHRYPDAGLLSLERDRFCYRSERTTVDLSPADVVEVAMVAAAPAVWRRNLPAVRFRNPETNAEKAFILHPLAWGVSGARLFRQIENWRNRAAASTSTIGGWPDVAGQPHPLVTLAHLWRGFRISAIAVFVGAFLAGSPLIPGAPSMWYALAVTAAAFAFLMLPSVLYKRPAPRVELRTPANAD
jgi:hypothetical protein